jgi:hypothetical protein
VKEGEIFPNPRLCPLYGFKAGAGDIARQGLAGRSFHSGNFSNFSLRLSGQSNSFQSAPHNEQAERWSSSERSATSTQMYAIKRACVLLFLEGRIRKRRNGKKWKMKSHHKQPRLRYTHGCTWLPWDHSLRRVSATRGICRSAPDGGGNQRRTHSHTFRHSLQPIPGRLLIFALAEEARRASLSLRLAAFHPAAWHPFLSSSSTGDCARKKAAELPRHRTTAVPKQPQKHRAPRTAQRKRRLERPWDDAAAANPSCRPEREFIVMAS